MSSDSPEPPRSGPSTQRRVANVAGIMTLGILASRVLGLVRESVIAHQFGQGLETDVYNAAFTIPDLMFFLIAGGALSGAFIPVFTDYIETNREKEAWRIFSVVASVMTIVTTLFIVFGEIFTAPLVAVTSGFINKPGGIFIPHGMNGFSQFSFLIQQGLHYMHVPADAPIKIAETITLTRIVLPAQICFFLGGLMMGSLQAKGKPLGQALGPVIYNLFIILGGIFLAPRYGMKGLCYGAVAGAIIGNLMLQWVLLIRIGGKFRRGDLFRYLQHVVRPRGRNHSDRPGEATPQLTPSTWHHGVDKVWKLMLPVLLGLALPQVSTIIGKIFAGSLGDGPASAFVNANKLMQVPLGVFAQATAIALLPVMSGQAARMRQAQEQNDPALARVELGRLRDSVNFGIRSILFLTIPSSVLMWVLALPFVQVVYQSGKFDLADAHNCAEVLRWFAIGIFAWSAHSIVTRGFYALHDSVTPIVIGTAVTLIFIPLNVPLCNLMQARGLALATSIAATIHMVSMLVMLRRRLKGLDGYRLLLSVSKTLFASCLTACLCTYFVYRPLYFRYLHNVQAGARTHAAIVLLICLSFSTAVYLGLALLLRMEEVSILKRIASKVLRRK